MGYSHRIDTSRRLIVGVYFENVTKQDVVDYYQSIKDDNNFDPSFDIIDSLEQVEHIPLSSTDIRVLSAIPILDRESYHARVASGNLAFALSRMSETFRELQQCHKFSVFRNKTNALQWINEGREKRNIPLLDLSLDPFEKNIR